MPEPSTIKVDTLVDHLFRHESGKMVAVLTRLFGIHRLELAEDIVQDTLHQALVDWSLGNIPDNPSGWLMVVAKRKAINRVRRESCMEGLERGEETIFKKDMVQANLLDNIFLEDEIKDSQLRMIFTCCHPALSTESQIALTLKTLCGFSIKEIAHTLLTTESNINKRLYRAKEKIRSQDILFEVPQGKALVKRVDSVLLAIYLLFNEGYYSLSSDLVIRRDLCLEAMRLAILLTETSLSTYPEIFALLALMCFHAARFDARMDSDGGLVILEEQDRDKWDKGLIDTGLEFLGRSMRGNQVSPYHLEAAIAGEHCTTRNFEETNWAKIFGYYSNLEKHKPSPIIRLNKAIILGKIEGPESAIPRLEELEQDKNLSSYYLLPASLGEFHLESGNREVARDYFKAARKLAWTGKEREMLDRKIRSCE
jgi:RNA polymerase sigma factor (sigma-70 family)